MLSTAVPLIAGGVFYIMFASETYVSEFLRSALPFAVPESGLIHGPFGDILRNYLCDVLWSWSLSTAVYAVMENVWISLGITAVFETAMELFQKIGIVPGTFDAWDIALELLSALFAAIVMYRKYYMKEK